LASSIASYKYLLAAGLSMLLVTCSVEKNTEASRFYHGMTARYNIYFNGYESYKAAVERVNNSYRDDYAEILNVFPHSDPSTPQNAASGMETAIQKASKLISLKSITARPDVNTNRDISEKERTLLDRKEYNEWVDDSYLLIGKARFYRHEFQEAEAVFNYCIAEANDPDIRTEATIWLARARIERKDFVEGFRILSGIKDTESLSKGMKAMYYTTLADLFTRQKRFTEAIEPLSKATELVSGKKQRYRLTYLLAQLNEQAGNGAVATDLYRKVVKMNPPYEVEFNARINIAGVFDVNSGDPGEIRKELQRMLRDAKNKEFGDQIYYALGNLAMKEGNEAEALDFYRKSAAATSSNQNQKGRSYLSLADYYFERGKYIDAGMYLDSAVSFLDRNHPQYAALNTRSANLNELVSQLVIIEREDSLQRVAALSPPERNAVISGIISDITKAEADGRPNDNTDRYNIGQYYENERRFQGNIEQEGKWYFYNQAALTFGRTEFRRRWGDRRPEDNWRRSNRARTSTLQAIPDDDTPGKPAAADTVTAATADYKSPEFYLRDLPLNDSLLAISNEKLSAAMLNAGRAYAERINDTVRSAETLESLTARFPAGPLVPEALYHLYRIHEKPNLRKAETYRQRLLERYPESEYTRILSDPDYYRKKRADLDITEQLYERAYELYRNEQFRESITAVNEALELYPGNHLAPKFMLLHAYSVGRITDERTFKEDLKILAETWPESPEAARARELMGHINEQMPELKAEEDIAAATEIYTTDTLTARTFALVIPGKTFNLNQATFDVISYNIDNYTDRNFRTEGTLIENSFLLITVSGFSNFSEALGYLQKFDFSRPVRNPSGLAMMMFVISDANLKTLLEDKNPERYQAFFRENFLR
jgi:tetratricopeptide (TPR) repeat protein